MTAKADPNMNADLRGTTGEQLFRRLIESVRDYAIFMLDVDGFVVSWNVGAERAKGYTAAEIIGVHFSRFYLPEDTGKCAIELEAASRDGRIEDEGWRVRKDGSRFWANVVISSMRDDDGKLLGFSKVTRDLTARRRADEDRAARLAAEEANRTKDEFLAMLGHELRNPLAPIVTALQLAKMREDKPSPEYAIIERQARHMMRLVDDLLDVSRISRGGLQLERQRFDLTEALTAGIEVATPLLERRRQYLVVDAAADLVVDGDLARIAQVVGNLVVNAAKYTPDGGHIAVKARRVGNDVVIDVTDDGIGIDADALPQIFDLFFQARQGIDRSQGGLGIGLRLVHSLVTLHGGRVVATSAGRGHGSTFTVTLPLASSSTAPPPPSLAPLTPRATTLARVLIVDDNEDAAGLLSLALERAGHTVAVAFDGLAALELAERFKPDVGVLDLGLPMMDGFELAAALRARRGDALHLIALTGYGQPHDRIRSAAAGFDEHFVKPIELQTLLASIETAVSVN